MNSSLIRVFWALLVHAAILLFACLIIYFLGSGQDSVAEATRSQYADRPGLLEDIRSDIVWQVINWCIYSVAVSWLIASFWLLIAERQRPATPVEGAAKLGLWVGCLVLTLVAMAVIGWSVIWRRSIEIDMAPGIITASMIIVGLTTFLAYYIGTALSVKTTMRPSIPLSGALPTLSKRTT